MFLAALGCSIAIPRIPFPVFPMEHSAYTGVSCWLPETMDPLWPFPYTSSTLTPVICFD